MRIFVAIYLLTSLGPLIRFYKNEYFYYFLIAAIIDPMVVLSAKLIGIPSSVMQFYIIGNLLLALTLPKVALKYKVGLILFIAFYSLIDRSEVTTLVSAIFIMLFLLINFAYRLIQNVRIEGKLVLFLIPLSVLYFFAIILAYLYYANIYIVTLTFIPKLVFYSCLNILIAVFGPNKKINFTFGYDPTIKAKIVSELQIHVDEYDQLLDKGFSHREIQIYQLIRQGYSNKNIAEKFSIEKRTVESHLKNIKTKLGFESMTELRDFVKKSEHIEPAR
ncbi:MAG: helix-turn-helix transcriptional regulator [Melioribacteraceae bacterium]|nr:helix-turn-helix transcriptional regulator [Melioribacteraceae bacterium]